jgi:hypothetical protein
MLSIQPSYYNSFHITASSNEELATAFLRLQEHYESPNDKFRGQIFTLGQYKKWYSTQKGAFTYYSDWRGFNIPSKTLIPFLEGLFDPLTALEESLIDLFRYSSVDQNFYIIGANDDETLNHELNHALYAYSPTYKTSIDELFDSQLEHIKYAMQHLLQKGYCRYMLYDELQSYILDQDSEIVDLIADNTIASKVHSVFEKFGENHYEN